MRSKASRDALKRLCIDVSAMAVDEVTDLQSEFHQSVPSLASVLNWCLNVYGTDAPFPTGISTFIKDISRNTPICAIFPPDKELRRVCASILRSSPIKEVPRDMAVLQQKCPSLFGFVSNLSESFVPIECIPLLTELLQLADNAFLDFAAPSDDSDLSPPSLLLHFPSLLPVRGRGTYTADRSNRVNENYCTKKSGRHPSLLPGIFLVFCQHGKCSSSYSCISSV